MHQWLNKGLFIARIIVINEGMIVSFVTAFVSLKISKNEDLLRKGANLNKRQQKFKNDVTQLMNSSQKSSATKKNNKQNQV